MVASGWDVARRQWETGDASPEAGVALQRRLMRVHLKIEEALRRATQADHGVLATLHATRGADLVPACFAIEDGWLAVPIDSVKPKGSTALGRSGTSSATHGQRCSWSTGTPGTGRCSGGSGCS